MTPGIRRLSGDRVLRDLAVPDARVSAEAGTGTLPCLSFKASGAKLFFRFIAETLPRLTNFRNFVSFVTSDKIVSDESNCVK